MCKVPFFAAADASQPGEQQATLRRRKVTNNVDPAESTNASTRGRRNLTGIAGRAI
jgi:hypothetical protein